MSLPGHPLTGRDPEPHRWADTPAWTQSVPRRLPDAQCWGCPQLPCSLAGTVGQALAASPCPVLTDPRGPPDAPHPRQSPALEVP